MPGLDQTGPMGEGPRTGRGRGICPPTGPAGDVAPVYGVGRGGLPRGGGRGRCFGGGRGQGRGRGWRHWQQATGLPQGVRAGREPMSNVPSSPEEERSTLKAQAERLEKTLNAIRSRISEIEATGGQQEE